MKHVLSKLENGIQVLTIPLPNFQSATVTVWLKVGSRYEPDKIAGISHFLEHMAFKGGKRYPSAKIVSETIDSIGGEFNAGTNTEYTNFYVKSQKDSLPIVFDVLSDMLINPLLKTADINRERGVILEEIAMYEDTPRRKIWDIYENLIFNGNPLGRDIIGSKKSVSTINRNDFINFRKLHYHPNNMLITVAGGVTHNNVLKLTKEYFSLPKTKTESVFTEFKPAQKKPQVNLKYKKSDQAHLVLGFLGYPYGHKQRFEESVLAAILGGGMSSRLFTEVREKRGLAYSVFAMADHAVDTGTICAYAGVDLKRIEKAIKVILNEFYKLTDHRPLITDRELKKAKEYIKGHLALSLEDTENVNSFYGKKQLLTGKVDSPEDIIKGIDKVTARDVISLAKDTFTPKTLNLAILGPYKDPTRFEKLIN